MQRQDDDTVHAAAIVLAAATRSTSTGLQRHQQQQLDDHASCAAAKKTRWWSRLKAKLKRFRPHGHPQRIADASRSPESSAPCAEQAAGSSSIHYYARHAPQPAVAFVAPPSSPASSVLTSESPSPVVLLNANNTSSSYSSPTASIFSIGPYAREPQQLVSPPAFSASAGLTEPSTAPVTPPQESSLHLLATTPSSPEVPFARFLWTSVAADQQPHCSGGGIGTASEGFLYAYQLQPGSPVLVSPGSTSSSPPPWNMQHWVGTHSNGGRVVIKDESNDDEAATGGDEFVFGSNADAAAGERFADGEVGGGGDATEQWPFLLAHNIVD